MNAKGQPTSPPLSPDMGSSRGLRRAHVEAIIHQHIERREASSRRNSNETKNIHQIIGAPEPTFPQPTSSTGAIPKKINSACQTSLNSEFSFSLYSGSSYQSEIVSPSMTPRRELEQSSRSNASSNASHELRACTSGIRYNTPESSSDLVLGVPASGSVRRDPGIDSITPSSSSEEHRSFLPALPRRISRRRERYHLSPKDLEENTIAIYLDEHQTFLQNYVLDKVPLEKFESWHLSKVRSTLAIQHTLPKIDYAGKKQLLDIHGALSDKPSEMAFMWEMAYAITASLKGAAFSIYKVDPARKTEAEIFIRDFEGPQPSLLKLVMAEARDTVYVLEAARRCTCVYISQTTNVLQLIGSGSIFPTQDDTTNLIHVMLVPILLKTGKTGYVIKIWRSYFYDLVDEKICTDFMVWASLAKNFCDMFVDKNTQVHVTDFLLDTVKTIFEDMATLDQVIKRILTLAQSLVNADRASLFLVDFRNQELVSTVFDLKFDEPYRNMEKKEIRIPIRSGIAGHVAISGESMNIPNAYVDPRFNREVDEATGYKTTSILCMPVKIDGRVIGVVQMVNKREQPKFSKEDETSFEIFSTFFGLALHHAKLYDKIMRNEQKYRVALEVLSYHSTCRSTDVNALAELEPHNVPAVLEDFSLDPYKLSATEKCQSVIIMFDRLFDMKIFNKMSVTRFVLTVKKNYRDVPYHNFDHGWSVAQTMYAILVKDKAPQRFQNKERLALFVASLCHDLDHRGYTNKYTSETASPLAAMYTTSTLEHHHFNITVKILQQDGHNIFSHFSSEAYKELLGMIRLCILATDLAAFFPNLDRIQNLCDENNPKFYWETKYHRELAMAMSMTASDLSASAKPWEVQIKTVQVIFQEFYDQGDKEKAAGKTPIAMMDRNKPEEQPASQVGFLKQICIPCYKIMKIILPGTKELLKMASKNLAQWQMKAVEENLRVKLSNKTIDRENFIASNENHAHLMILSPVLENDPQASPSDKIDSQQGILQDTKGFSKSYNLPAPLIQKYCNVPLVPTFQKTIPTPGEKQASVFALTSSPMLLQADKCEPSTTIHPDIDVTNNSKQTQSAAAVFCENVISWLEEEETITIPSRPAEPESWVDNDDESLKTLCVRFNCKCQRNKMTSTKTTENDKNEDKDEPE